MDPPSPVDLDSASQAAAPAPAARPRTPLKARVRRAGERAVLWLHRQADRFDVIPTEFGEDVEVDQTDARAILREWLRQARLWAGYNPEEMFALKAGAVAVGLALLMLVALVGAVR